jgi:hypothetical protein
MKLKVDIDKTNVDSGFIDVRRWFNRYELYTFETLWRDRTDVSRIRVSADLW